MKILAALSAKGEDQAEASSREVEFVWLWLDDDPQKERARIARAVELGDEAGALMETIFPPVFTFYFGAVPHLKVSANARLKLVDSLKKEFESTAKVYHGKSPAVAGNIGSSTRFSYSVMIRGRTSLLLNLCALPSGEYRDYKKRG